MALPKIKHPTYSITIPSTKQQVNIRPFTVQEEKLLLMAKSSDNASDIINTLKQIINNCVIETIDVDKLATFDIEYIFLKLRAKSIGEMVDLEYKVQNTDEVIKFKFNLDDVEVVYKDSHTNKFNVVDDIWISMRYPTLEEIKTIEGSSDETAVIGILIQCIDKVFDDNTVYNDFTDIELADFVNSLPMDALLKIKDFFETMPSVEHTINLKSKSGEIIPVLLKGLNSFFI
jgi:hypothetical protein